MQNELSTHLLKKNYFGKIKDDVELQFLKVSVMSNIDAIKMNYQPLSISLEKLFWKVVERIE